jgi:hypothetical protein
MLGILALIVFLGAALFKVIGGHASLVIWLIILGGVIVSIAATGFGPAAPWRRQ